MTAPDDAPLFREEAIEEAARVLADLLHADEPGTAYDLALAVLNSAGVRHEVKAAMLLGGGVVESSSEGAPIDLGFLSLPQELQDAVNVYTSGDRPRLQQATADAALDEAERTGGAYTAREPRGDRA